MAAVENSINDNETEKLLENVKDDCNENVKKCLKYFATCFHRHFYEQKDICIAENPGQVRKKSKSTRSVEEIGEGMPDALMFFRSLEIRIHRPIDHFGQRDRQRKAKANILVFKDAERKLSVDVIRSACLLFQMFEVQFMKMTVDRELDTTMDFLATDAVKRFFDFVEAMDQNPESNTTIDHDFIVSSIIMDVSKKDWEEEEQIGEGVMKYNDIICNSEDIFNRVGIIVNRKNSDGTDNIILCKRIRNDGSDIFGFRLNHNSETEIPTGYTEIDVNSKVYNKYKTENCERFLNSEILEKILDEAYLKIKKDKLVWFNVKVPAESFIGREKELERISKDLEKGPVFIVGLKGVGKSELASKYVSLNYKQGQCNVVWINAENEQSTTMWFKALHSEYVGLTFKLQGNTEKSVETIKEEVYDHFKDQNVLFVYDNISDRNIIDIFSPANSRRGLNTIYTSNSVKNEKTDGSTIELIGFTSQETVKVIQMYLPLSAEEDIHKLGEAMNNSPLGLKIAASYIKASNTTITTFLYLLENSNHYKYEFLRRSENCTKAIYSSINITLEHLKSLESDDSKFAVEILKIAAFTSSNQIPLDVFKSIAYQRLTNIQRDDFRHESALGKVDRALELLDEYSLLEHRQKNEINIHSPVQLTIQTIIQESAANSESIIENIMIKILKAAVSTDYILHTSAWKHAFWTSDVLWKKLIDKFIANRNGSFSYFHGICLSNEFEVVDRVLRTISQHYPTSSFDVNKQDTKGNTAIHLAAGRGSQKIVQILIENNAKLNITNTNLWTSLHCAVFNGHADIVADILKHPEGMQILNAKSKTGKTTMHMVALKGQLGILQLLIKKGAKLNITDSELRTPLHDAVLYGHVDIVAEILKHPEGMQILNAKLETAETALHMAALAGHLGILQLLIEKGAELNNTDAEFWTPLHNAVFYGHTDIVAEILNHPEWKQIINAKSRTDQTALHMAALEGKLGIFQLLIEKGAKLNITDLSAVLHDAVFKGFVDIVAEILKHPVGMKILNAKTESGMTALHWAAVTGHLSILKLLIKKGAELNIIDTHLRTPLHYAAPKGYADIIAEILEHPQGMQIINAKTDTGETAMHWAAHEDYLGILQLLIAKGAKLDITNTDLGTPLYYAAINGHPNIVAEILKHHEGMQSINAKTKSGRTAIHSAALTGHLSILQMLIEKGAELNTTNTDLWTPLHCAAMSTHADIVAEILKYPGGMQIINAKTEIGRTAMHMVAARGHLSILQMLIEKGAELNITDTVLGTPLHLASLNGHVDIVAEILKHAGGMQIINAKTKTGQTAMHYAAAKGYDNIVAKILEHGQGM